jgi:hypothetical protein
MVVFMLCKAHGQGLYGNSGPLGSCLEVSYFCNDLVLGHYHTQIVTL